MVAGRNIGRAVGDGWGRVPLDVVAEDPWFTHLGRVRPLPLKYTVPKRLLDLGVALALSPIAVLLAPFVAVAIRRESPGPVLFRQQRTGLGGHQFQLYKFRTMREDAVSSTADWTQVVWTRVGDPRVTRIGRLLRLTRIDEFPQLWNVLRGEMSLVGPRPEWVKSTMMLEREVPHYAKRYAVKPGLTGWAQVRCGYMSTVSGTQTKLEYDLYYVKHASLALDARILLRTILVVLQRQGR